MQELIARLGVIFSQLGDQGPGRGGKRGHRRGAGRRH